jgi:hypothetical protein
MTISLFGGHHRTLQQFEEMILEMGTGLTVEPWYGNAGEHDNMLVLEVYHEHEEQVKA